MSIATAATTLAVVGHGEQHNNISHSNSMASHGHITAVVEQVLVYWQVQYTKEMDALASTGRRGGGVKEKEEERVPRRRSTRT
jgi:hypothetical protein